MATTRPRPRFIPALVLGAGASLLLAAPSPLAFAAKGETSLRMVGLRTEYKENPLGIDARTPRLSWRIESDGRGVVQSAYEIRVARSERGLGAAGDRVWESGKVASDESIHRPYGGPRARVRPAVPLAGAGVGRGREGLGLERAGVVGDGASRALGLEGELDRAGPAGGRDEVGSGADAAPRIRAERRRGASAGLRDEPRALRDAPERPSGGGSALHPRVDQLQQAPAVPDVRRDALPEGGRQRGRRRARQRLVPRGTSPGASIDGTSTATGSRCCCRSRSPTRTGASSSSGPTRPGRRPRARS